MPSALTVTLVVNVAVRPQTSTSRSASGGSSTTRDIGERLALIELQLPGHPTGVADREWREVLARCAVPVA
jgi:hypothetical protein